MATNELTIFDIIEKNRRAVFNEREYVKEHKVKTNTVNAYNKAFHMFCFCYLTGEENVTEIAKKVKSSSSTLYNWIKKYLWLYEPGNLSSCNDHSIPHLSVECPRI